MLARIKTIAEIGAATSALLFFAAAIYVIWPYRSLAAPAAQLVQAWTPKKGHIDESLDTVEKAMPAPGKADQVAEAARKTVASLAPIGPAVTEAIATTAANVNRKCAGSAGSDACGTLAQVNKTMIDAGDAIVTTQIGERAATKSIVATMGDLDQDAKDLDVDLKDHAVHNAAANLAAAAGGLATIEGTTNEILLDVKKETDQMVAPKTRAQQILGYAPAALKLGLITACIATGTACP